jgi:serralysin
LKGIQVVDVPQNFISITIDDMNAFAFIKSLYGGNVYTPNIDRVMEMGTTFENSYSQVALCNPSRTATLTGLNPTITGVATSRQHWSEYIDPSETMTALFRDSGYETSVIGKVYHTIAQASQEIQSQLADFIYAPASDEAMQFDDTGPSTLPLELQVDYLSVDQAIAQLNQADATNSPFALFLGITKPHLSWVVPQEFFDLYPLDSIELPDFLEGDISDIPAFMKQFLTDEPGAGPNDIHAWKLALQGYFASISFADAMLGRTLDALEANGQLDNTAILLWTDHGYHLGDKDNWHKFTLWEEAARAPFVLALPGSDDDGQRVSQPVELVDIMPTILELFGITAPDGLSGRSLLPFIEDPTLTDDGVAITTMFGSASLRSGDWRYIRYQDGSEELYQLAIDPNQWVNLAEEPAFASTVAALKARLNDELEADGWYWVEPGESVTGSAADETFLPVSGSGPIKGGDGNDTYFIYDDLVNIGEGVDGGIDRVFTMVSYTLPSNIENLIYEQSVGWTTDLIELTGNALDNYIFGRGHLQGLDGNDILKLVGGGSAEGGNGNDDIEGSPGVQRDQLRGGSGSDKLWGFGGDDQLIGGNGLDLLLGGTGNDFLKGDDGADELRGAAGDDILNGGAHRDVIDGGAGIDTVSYAGSLSGVTVSLAITTEQYTVGAGIDVLIEIENLTGSDFADRLTGNAVNNVLNGGAGNDLLDGAGGLDTVTYETATAGVTLNLGLVGPQNTVGSGSDMLLSIENLIGSAFADILKGNTKDNWLSGGLGADSLEGGFGNDTLVGGAGNDVLHGGTGIDTLSGGTGSDLYWVNEAGDVIIEKFNEGNDSVFSTVTFTLSENVESLSLLGTAATNGTGNLLDNTLLGNEAANVLYGLDGSDIITGGGGHDTLQGGSGKDLLNGGISEDRLIGGKHADRFIFNTGDTAGNRAQADVIVDFAQVERDRIDLSAIDADEGVIGDQRFHFISRASFSGTAGELRYERGPEKSWVEADTDGDGQADLVIALVGTITLTTVDFIL